MPDNPGVAVIIAARNEAGLIARAVRSALRQSCASEVIVVDDASADGTGEAAWRCDDGTGRLRVLRLDVNRGPAASRNHAIASSTAPYLCALDADDYMQDERIATVLDRAGRDWDLVADDLNFAADDQPDLMLGTIGVAAQSANGLLSFAEFVAGNLYKPSRGRVELGFLKPVISRRFLDATGLRYQEQLRLGEDFMLYAEALIHGAQFRLIPVCGYVSVQRARSLSLTHSGRDLELLAEADRRLLASPALNQTDRALLRQHRNRLLNRAYHHGALEAKRAGKLRETLGYLLRRPSSTAYIVQETLRAKLAFAMGAGRAG